MPKDRGSGSIGRNKQAGVGQRQEIGAAEKGFKAKIESFVEECSSVCQCPADCIRLV